MRRISAELKRLVPDRLALRALGFCVSIEHADFMARELTRLGVPAAAVHGDTPAEERATAPERLRRREINVLFTYDLYNEGVDLRIVDTLLLLRPTMSATRFMQQLGRGLRHHWDERPKTSCLVLDFIGQPYEKFRFDVVLSALTSVPRAGLRRAVEDGFPYLPSGCALQIDQRSREQILKSLRASVTQAAALGQELRALAERVGRAPTLREFLEHTNRELEEIYGAARSFRELRRQEGQLATTDPPRRTRRTTARRRRRQEGQLATTDPDPAGWTGGFRRLLHIDEPARLRRYQQIARGAAEPAPPLLDVDAQRLHMLYAQVQTRGALPVAEDSVAYLSAHPAAAEELEQLSEVLADRVALAMELYPVAEWPLALHRHYDQREILTAVGHLQPGRKLFNIQGGVLKLEEQWRELLLVTLDKSGGRFSPTTRYRDYALGPDRFHWETQGRTSQHRTGRRYIEPEGWTFYLFVRTDPDAAYAFRGPVEYISHSGDEPMAITWRLRHPMPAGLFARYAPCASG